ncbi:MAG: thiamine phosphate synthase [Chitinispirillaceae bacterium]|nr:thiamine phosphate synthase [Chitinispirillaceae bacterium]
MEIPNTFGLYAILTDPVKGYEYMTRLLVDHGASFIQLRMKQEPAGTILANAERLRAITAGSGSRLIINDHPGIAAKVNADGVHLGQEDLPFADARAIVGPNAIIGLSTHSPAQTIAACALRPEYIGVGPVFPTPTKAKADPALGLDGMKTMLAAATVPAVAIGGIDLTNLRDVLSAGARNFCMVRQLMQAKEPEKVLMEVGKICGEFF